MMSSRSLGRYALCASMSVAMLAGCGGSQPSIGAPGAMPQSRAIATLAGHGGSWMLPEARSEDLIYITATNGEARSSSVFVYSYGGTLEGTLTGFSDPSGECVDSAGDVFIINSGASDIIEYTHGGSSPIATLSDPGYYPSGCSVDSATDTLAVANESNSISIYQDAQGSPTVLTDSEADHMFFCSYDNRSNLFISGGIEGRGDALLFELPRGSSQFQVITVNESLGGNSPVQWDGEYVAFGYGENEAIYQISVSGSMGTVVGTTRLTIPHDGYISNGLQWWIQGRSLLAPYITRHVGHALRPVGFWSYPTGGGIKKHFVTPDKRALVGGVTVSVAPK